MIFPNFAGAIEPQNKPKVTSDNPNPTAFTSQTKVSVTVPALRVIVVDDKSQITEIWSNTGNSVDNYTLEVRPQSLAGSKVPISKQIGKQYQKLSRSINWNPAGVVYKSDKQGIAYLTSLIQYINSYMIRG